MAPSRSIARRVRRLSHNLLQSLNGFTSLVALEELNLNFNQLTSLDGVEGCGKLKRLYLSNNRLVQVDRLCSLAALHTVCLFGNQLAGLQPTLEHLRRCPKLRERHRARLVVVEVREQLLHLRHHHIHLR